MTCEAYRALLDRAMDGEATQAELENMRQHEHACADCAALRQALTDLQHELTSLKDETPPMPADFHQRWTTLVEEDAMDKQSKKGSFRSQITRILSVAAALVFVIGGTMLTRDDLAPRSRTEARSSVSGSAYGYTAAQEDGASAKMMEVKASRAYANNGMGLASTASFDADVVMEAEEAMDMAMDDAGDVNPSKIIRTANITLATREYDQVMEQVRAAVTQYNGWISYSYETTASGNLHRANLTLRIPSQHLDSFLSAAGDLGRVTSRSESANDVSDSYYDTKTRLATQEALLARLQALITDAADLSDLLELENQIANTQYTIDRLKGSLQATDRQVDYSTVELTVREESAAAEVVQTDLSLGERISSAFAAGWEAFAGFAEDMLVFLVAALPFILVVAVVVAAVHVVRKKGKVKRQKAE